MHPAVAFPDTTQQIGRKSVPLCFRLANPLSFLPPLGPTFADCRSFLPMSERMNREGLDVVTIRAVPREGREVPTDQRRYGRFWD
jgi:hypothetical protein